MGKENKIGQTCKKCPWFLKILKDAQSHSKTENIVQLNHMCMPFLNYFNCPKYKILIIHCWEEGRKQVFLFAGEKKIHIAYIEGNLSIFSKNKYTLLTWNI